MNNVALHKIVAPFLWCLLVLGVGEAQAYLGPGAGLGMLGSLLAIAVTVVVLLLGLVIYPIRLLRKRKKV